MHEKEKTILDLDAIFVFLFLLHSLPQANWAIQVDIRQQGTQEGFQESGLVYTKLEVTQSQITSTSPGRAICYH